MVRLAPPYHPPGNDRLLDLYIDAHMVVVNKPSGLLSVPGRGPGKHVCAVSIAEARHGDIFVVHRLDMDTSGLLVLARTKTAQTALSKAFQNRQVEKTYIACVEGGVDGDTGEINLPIARYSRQRPLRHVEAGGQAACTRWTVLERQADFTRLRLTPLTGRSHQLRVHLAAIGHPIVGDPFYGDETLAKRLLLHAKTLKLSHPARHDTLHFEAEPDF